MIYVPLINSDKFAIVDEDVAEIVLAKNWRLSTKGGVEHDGARGKGCTREYVRLARIVMGLTIQDESKVEHIDTNCLDCRKENLRLIDSHDVCTRRRAQRGKRVPYKGVSESKSANKTRYIAQITNKGIPHRLGSFDKAIMTPRNWTVV